MTIEENIDKIQNAFQWNRWGHWVSLTGLIYMFQPSEKPPFFQALKKLKFKTRVGTVNGTFNLSPRKYFFTPCFKKQYWEKAIEVKKKVPIIKLQKRSRKTPVSNCHCYEMLLNQPWIPSFAELMFWEEWKQCAPFDFDYYAGLAKGKDYYVSNSKNS